MQTPSPHVILDFWFKELGADAWFAKSDATDFLIRQRFSALNSTAMSGGLEVWRSNAQGRLAEIIVLDQFSRNMFRDDSRAFAGDPLALALAQEAVELRLDQDLAPQERAFLYMPFMHSELPEAHDQALILFDAPGLEFNLNFEKKHKAIIDRFGRYPHRNEVLGRTSTNEELIFLTQEGSSF